MPAGLQDSVLFLDFLELEHGACRIAFLLGFAPVIIGLALHRDPDGSRGARRAQASRRTFCGRARIDSRLSVAYFGPMASFLRRPFRYSYYNATIILIVVNVLVFLFGMVDRQGRLGYLALIPAFVLQGGAWWQVITYMFVHAGWSHIFFNMLALFLFGIQLERHMGSPEFLLFYFFTGIGAGIATVFINSSSGMGIIPVVGASGAIFGLLLGFASFFPDARIFIFGILPMRAPVAVLLYAGIEIVLQVTNVQSGVAHLTHLAGIAFAYLYIVVRFGINPIAVFLGRR